MSDNGQQVPLPGCMIGPSEPCDAFQRQTARIAELEAALAAERERREAAEKVLSWLDMRGGLGYEKHGRIADHFARYEKEPT